MLKLTRNQQNMAIITKPSLGSSSDNFANKTHPIQTEETKAMLKHPKKMNHASRCCILSQHLAVALDSGQSRFLLGHCIITPHHTNNNKTTPAD
jgi:hypothetical protein